jgi:hypothetical protein
MDAGVNIQHFVPHSVSRDFEGNTVFKKPKSQAGRFHEDVFEHIQHMKHIDPWALVPVFTLDRGSKMKNRRTRNFDLDEFELEYGNYDEARAEYGLACPNVRASYLSISKYARLRPAMSDPKQVWALNRAYGFLSQHFAPFLQDTEVVSLEEAVASVDMTTSPGVVWSKKFRTKREFFTTPVEGWDPLKWLEEDWERLKNDDYTSIFGNSVKEEMRLQEKLDRNSMRTFTAGPVEMTIHGNRLFLHQNQCFYESALSTSSTVGFCQWYGGWDEMFRKLSVYPNGYALDETEYDSSIFSAVMWMIAKFRMAMLVKPAEMVTDTVATVLGEDEQKLRPTMAEYEATQARVKQFYKNLINTLISTMGGTVVMKNGGNPSGSSNTIVDNTFALYLFLAYSWCMKAPEDQCEYSIFDDQVKMLLCGDDNTWTVSDESHPFYNAKSVIDAWKPLRVIATTDTLEARNPEDLDYLSAYSRELHGKLVPRYPTAKLMASLAFSENHAPPLALAKAAALRMNGWTNSEFLLYINNYIKFLLKKYEFLDRGAGNNPEIENLCRDWQNAKRSIKTDDQMMFFYTGRGDRRDVMHPQGRDIWPKEPLHGTPAYEEYYKCALPIKTKMSSKQSKSKQPAGQKRSRRGPRRGIKVASVSAIVNAMKGRKGPARRRKGKNASKQFPSSTNSRMSRRHVTVVEDEYIAEVNGSIGFATTAYAINPGQSTTFPWLSRQASQWEKYRFKKIQFYYKPEVSAYATNGQSGKVILSGDYDASDAAPTSKQQVEDTVPHADAMPYNAIALTMDPKQLAPAGSKYVRTGGVPASNDIKTYDGGILYVSTSGNQSTSIIGELHVRYEVDFEVPVLDAEGAAAANYSVAWFTNFSTYVAMASGVTYMIDFPDIPHNGIGAVQTAGVITLPAGNYLCFVDTEIKNASSGLTQNITEYLVDGVTQVARTSIGPAEQTRSVSLSAYVTSNGTTTVSVRLTAVSTSGVNTMHPSFIIQAV